MLPGDKVTCKVAVEAYYSNYGPNPRIEFLPGMVGIVAAIVPKVRIVRGPQHDGKDEMVVIDFHCPTTNKQQRASLDFCNVKVYHEPT